MDKVNRAALIRATYRAKVGSMAYVPSGKPIKPIEPTAGRIDSQSFGLALSHRWGRTEWLETPDAKPSSELSERNRKGVPALALIAAKAPKKLARAYPTAEQWLASRKRR